MESDNDLRNADDRVGADFALQHFWPGCTDQTSDWVGLNVLLIVLRHLGSFIPYESRSNEMTQRHEDQNPILKLVWQKIQATTPLESEMTLRLKVSEVFMQEGTNPPTFQDLLTHPLMKETLLSSPGYQLFTPQSWALNPGPPRVWQPGRLFDDKEISQTTPFHWDGKRPLDDVLDARFGPFRDPKAPDSGRLLLHMFAKPWFMFINYFKKDNNNMREFESLQKLNFEASDFVLQDNGQGYVLAHTKVAYTLVAVVFQTNGASNDFVRLYALDGSYIHPPSSAQDIVTYDQWSVAPDQGNFTLVYAKDTDGRRIEYSQEIGSEDPIFDGCDETDSEGAGVSGDPEFDFPFMYPHPKQSSHAGPSRQCSVVDGTASMSPAPQSTRSASVDKSGTRPSQSTTTVRGRGAMAATARGRGSPTAIGRGRGTMAATARGRGSPTAIGRGRGSPTATGRGRGSVAPLARGGASTIPTTRGGATPTPITRGGASAVPTSRGGPSSNSPTGLRSTTRGRSAIATTNRGSAPTRATSRAGGLPSQQGSSLSQQTTTQSFLNGPTTATASTEVPTTQSNTSAPRAPSRGSGNARVMFFGSAEGDPPESSEEEGEEFDEDMPDRSIDETNNDSRPTPHQFPVNESRQGQILQYPDEYSSQSQYTRQNSDYMEPEPAGSQWTGRGSNRGGRARGNNNRRGSGDHYDSYRGSYRGSYGDSYGDSYGGTEDDYHNRGGTYRGSRGNRGGRGRGYSNPNSTALGTRRGGRH